MSRDLQEGPTAAEIDRDVAVLRALSGLNEAELIQTCITFGVRSLPTIIAAIADRIERSTVVVYVDGGVIQEVTATDPRVRVIVIDFDCDSDDGAHVYVDGRGKHEEVWATEWTPSQPVADEIERARKATVTDWMNDVEEVCGDCGLSLDEHTAETCETVRVWGAK